MNAEISDRMSAMYAEIDNRTPATDAVVQQIAKQRMIKQPDPQIRGIYGQFSDLLFSQIRRLQNAMSKASFAGGQITKDDESQKYFQVRK